MGKRVCRGKVGCVVRVCPVEWRRSVFTSEGTITRQRRAGNGRGLKSTWHVTIYTCRTRGDRFKVVIAKVRLNEGRGGMPVLKTSTLTLAAWLDWFLFSLGFLIRCLWCDFPLSFAGILNVHWFGILASVRYSQSSSKVSNVLSGLF